MKAKITALLRNTLSGSFSDKSSGELIQYKQLQAELTDPETGALEIKRISVRKTDWGNLPEIEKLQGKIVSIDVDMTVNNNRERLQFDGEVKQVNTAVRQAS